MTKTYMDDIDRTIFPYVEYPGYPFRYPTHLPLVIDRKEADLIRRVPKLTTINISADKTEGATSDTFTFGIQYLDQTGVNYQLTAEENAQRQWIVSEGATMDDNKLTVDSRGAYAVKMKIGEVESNEVTIVILAEGQNLALNKTIVSATEGSHDPANAVDGKDTMWITDEPADAENHEYDAELVVDLGDTYDVNCVHTWFEGASSADYTVTFSLDNVTFTDPVADFTVTNGVSKANRHDWLTSEETVKARYVKFHSTRAATQYGTKLHEIGVYSNSKAQLSSIELTVDNKAGIVGNTFTYTPKYFDQFGYGYTLTDEW